jgi:hypothetical protein
MSIKRKTIMVFAILGITAGISIVLDATSAWDAWEGFVGVSSVALFLLVLLCMPNIAMSGVGGPDFAHWAITYTHTLLPLLGFVLGWVIVRLFVEDYIGVLAIPGVVIVGLINLWCFHHMYVGMTFGVDGAPQYAPSSVSVPSWMVNQAFNGGQWGLAVASFTFAVLLTVGVTAVLE